MANKFGMFLIGGVVGAVAALLAAPRPGVETRAMVADKANEFVGNASSGAIRQRPAPSTSTRRLPARAPKW